MPGISHDPPGDASGGGLHRRSRGRSRRPVGVTEPSQVALHGAQTAAPAQLGKLGVQHGRVGTTGVPAAMAVGLEPVEVAGTVAGRDQQVLRGGGAGEARDGAETQAQLATDAARASTSGLTDRRPRRDVPESGSPAEAPGAVRAGRRCSHPPCRVPRRRVSRSPVHRSVPVTRWDRWPAGRRGARSRCARRPRRGWPTSGSGRPPGSPPVRRCGRPRRRCWRGLGR